MINRSNTHKSTKDCIYYAALYNLTISEMKVANKTVGGSK